MVAIDTIEGTIDNALWFHFDMTNDVLYLRLSDCREIQTYADEQEDGTLILHRLDNDKPVGVTIINWWKNYGTGSLPDSLRRLEQEIEPFASKIAA